MTHAPRIDSMTRPEHHSGPGPRLRAQRQSLRLSLEEVSRRSGVSADYLRAIERDQTDKLPTLGYAVGYIRSYARILGLDPEAAVRDLKLKWQADGLAVRRPSTFSRLSSSTRRRLPRGVVPALGVIAAVVMLGTWYGVQLETQATTVATQTTPIALDETAIEDSTPISDSVLTLRATAPSWVSIRDNRNRLVANRVFVTGETWQTEVGRNYVISVRDGGAVNLEVGDRSLGPIGRPGEPVQGLDLSTIQRVN